MKKLILLLSIIILNSCGIQRQPAIEITHVLAITATNDTLKLPISAIRPNVYYNVSHYGYARPYIPHYYSQQYYNNRPIYVTPSGNNNNNPSPNPPPVVRPPKPVVPIKPSAPSINKGNNRN